MMRPAAFLACFCFACAGFAATLESDHFHIHFEEQDRSIAEETLAELEKSRLDFARYLDPGDDPVTVTIVGSVDDFEEALGVEAGATVQAFATGPDTMVMRPPRLLRPGANYFAVLRHELAHLLLARNANPENLPRWLNEGIAMMISGEIRTSGPLAVSRMYLTGSLIPYDDLAKSFENPLDEQEFGDAYAQSQSMTIYLREQMGEAGFWNFVRSLDTEPFAVALQQRSGLTTIGLYENWKADLRPRAWGTWLVSGIFALQIGAFLLFLAYWRRRRRARSIVSDWELEEAVDDILEKPSASDPPADEDEWQESEDGKWWY